LAAEEERRVVWWFALPATVAAAFFHAGMWAHHGLRRSFCPTCYKKVLPLVGAATLLVLTGVACGVAVWFTIIDRFKSPR
jgi:hypothetical protein